jgi:hypothetical protein
LSAYWDQTTCIIINDSGSALSVVGAPSLAQGEFGTFPSAVAAHSIANPAFVAQSLNASEVGPQGSLSYQMPDGTQLTIAFNQMFAITQVSTFTVTLAGPNAGSYGVSLNCGWVPWSSWGTRWTVNLTLSAGAGSAEAQCQYTR